MALRLHFPMMEVSWLETAQRTMREQRIDGWLVYDFRGGNPVFSQLLGRKFGTTRRAVLFVPATGRPRLLLHAIDAPQFESIHIADQKIYISWQELFETIRSWVGGKRIAMEYSADGALPAASIVDGGTIDAIRAMHAEIASSADLVQLCVATWSEQALEDHLRAAALVTAAKDDAFEFVRRSLRDKMVINEYDVQQRILSRFAADHLDPDHPPIVGVNEHSGDPHFEPSATNSSNIKTGDWLLIDLWARWPGEKHIFSDITWVGYCGSQVPDPIQNVYDVVEDARDLCLQFAVDAWKERRPIQGWELDDRARKYIASAGFGQFIRHRTGHSLSPGPKVHGLGMNIDNLETHDTRTMLPGLGFTIEPGIYLPEFGVRSEINVFVDPTRGPIVTSCVQREIELLAQE